MLKILIFNMAIVCLIIQDKNCIASDALVRDLKISKEQKDEFLKQLEAIPFTKEDPDEEYVKKLSLKINVFLSISREDIDARAKEKNCTHEVYLHNLMKFTVAALEIPEVRIFIVNNFDSIHHDFVKITCAFMLYSKKLTQN